MTRPAVVALLLAALAASLTFALGGFDGPPDPGSPLPDPGAVEGAPSPAPSAVPPVEAVARTEREDPALLAAVASLATDTGVVGYVRDADGAPVPGAAVWLLLPDRDQRIGSATADAHGAFAFVLGLDDDLGVAAFRLAAHHPAHGLSDPVAVARPADGGTARVDLVVDRPGLSISGVVTGPGGEPVPSHPIALVRVDPNAAALPEWRVGRDQAEVRTGADGSFIAHGLRPGAWEVDFEASDAPLGFDVDPPPLRIEVPAGTRGLRLAVPFVRVEVAIVDADGRSRRAERVVARAFVGDDAAAAASRHAAGEPLDGRGLRSDATRRDDVDATAFFVAPGAFLVLGAESVGRTVDDAFVVPGDRAVRALRLALGGGPEAVGGIALGVVGPDGTRPARVLVRLTRKDGLHPAPPGLDDLGSGWLALPGDGRLALPPGEVRVEVLGDPIEADRAWYPLGLLPVELEVVVPREPRYVDRPVRLRTGAWIEVEVAQDADPTDVARSAWREGRLPDGTPVLKGYASAERPGRDQVALRLAFADADGLWRPVLGVPHRPGGEVLLRALGVFEPGPCRFALQTWRPATLDDSGGWPLELRLGRNVVRLRLDRDGVLHWLPR